MKGCIIVNTILINFLSSVLCQANFMHLWCDSTVYSWEFPPQCQWETCPKAGRKAGKGLGLYLHSRSQAHDGKVFQLVLLSCAQFWQALLVGCSVPPTTKIKTQNQIRIILQNESPISHTKSTPESVVTPPLFTRQTFPKHLLPSLEDHVLPKKTRPSVYKQGAWSPEKPGMHKYTKWYDNFILMECYLCPLWHSIKLNTSSLSIWDVTRHWG